MSSPLYAVRVLDVAGTVVKLDVTSVETAGCYSLSRLFAVSMLHEPFWNTVYAAPGKAWPAPITGALQSQFDEDTLMDWGGVGVPTSEQHRLSRVVDMGYMDFRNVPPLPFPPDADGVYRSTGALPQSFRDAVNRLRDAAPRPPLTARPGATLRIEVSAPKWVSHLAQGMIWDSYVFDDNAPVLF